ncbi:MAG: hypothetical protein JWM21_4841 [Acidobacteria bacterium]|nr:hypothetical protein [Acidobacteriota bacterium]
MKRCLLALANLFVILTVLVLPGLAQRKNEVTALPFSETPYFVGERLTYNVSFSNFVSAGHVELFVAAHGAFYGRDAIELRAHVETTGVVYAALFALNNDYISYVDPANGQPFRAQQVVREAARSSDTSSDFNQPAGTAAIPDKLRTGEFPGTYDFLSALYRLRALPLAEGSTYYLTVRSESQEFQVELKVKGHEAIRTNVGSFNALVTQIRVTNDSAANNYHVQIYFTDDERHVPVLITAKTRAGDVRAELAGSQLVPGLPAKVPTKPVEVPQPTPAPGPIGTPIANNLLNGLPFKVGEQLNYQAFLATVQQPVGTIAFQVRPRSRYFDHDGLLFTVTAETTNAAQRLFFAKDTLSSYVDPATLLPFRFEVQLAEGKRRSKDTLTINQDYGTATNEQGRKIEMPVGTHDYLSIFYAVRSMNLAPPKRNAVSILVNGRAKTLVITALRRETIQIGTQKIPAIQLSLTTDDQQPDKYALRAWISDDDRRLPLRLTATTELGQLHADLVILPLTRQ